MLTEESENDPARSVALWSPSPAMPAVAKAAFMAGLLLLSQSTASVVAACEAALKASDLYDELQANFTAQRAGWHPANRDGLLSMSLAAIASVSPDALERCSRLIP